MEPGTRKNPETGKQAKHGDARDRIAHCALELFATQGYSATSVRQIVECVGVTKPTLYYHFQSKENLYQTLLNERLGLFHDRIETAAQERGSLEERLERVVNLYFEALGEMPHIARLLFRAMLGSSPNLPPFDHNSFTQGIQNKVHSIFKDAAQNGEIPRSLLNPFITVEFLGLTIVFVLRSAIGYADHLTHDKARLVVRLFLNGLRGLAEKEEPSLLETLEEGGFDCV